MDDNVRSILVGDKKMDVTPVQVRSSNELWNEYLLADGTTVRLKLVITESFVLKDVYDGDGRPVYVFRWANPIIITDSPKYLWKTE